MEISFSAWSKTLAPLGRIQPQGSREEDSQWIVEDLWLQQGDGCPRTRQPQVSPHSHPRSCLNTTNDVLFPKELLFEAHLILQLSLAVMFPHQGEYSFKLWLRQDIFGIIGLLLGIHNFQIFALKIPSKVSWGDGGVELLSCLHLLGSSGSASAGNHDPMECPEVRISDGGCRKTMEVAGTP